MSPNEMRSFWPIDRWRNHPAGERFMALRYHSDWKRTSAHYLLVRIVGRATLTTHLLLLQQQSLLWER